MKVVLNEMMDRPIVMEKVVDFMRTEQGGFSPAVAELQRYANERRIPIIPHETAKLLDFLCAIYPVQAILEIGTAIGFSAALMAEHLEVGGTLDTIERNPRMFEQAEANFKRLGLEETVRLHRGDAVEILDQLTGPYDLIFMDSAKSKYVDFYPPCLELLKEGGLLIIDDIFQGGTVLDPLEDIPRRVRTIHRKLNELLDLALNDSRVRSTLVPVGDGLLLVRKEENTK